MINTYFFCSAQSFMSSLACDLTFMEDRAEANCVPENNFTFVLNELLLWNLSIKRLELIVVNLANSDATTFHLILP